VRPLRRRPKQLTEPPTLFQPSGSGGGTVLSSGDRRRSGTGASRAGGTAPGTTDEAADVVALADLTAQSDADRLTRARARQIARRLSVPRPPRDQRRRGVGELASLSWNGGSDELDLERTLEAVAGIAHPEATDLVVRERVRQRRSVVLVVDVSGSMKGERVRTAAATVGALAGELARDWLAVVAFWSDAAVLVRMREQVRPLAVLDLLLRVPTQGLTNVSFALETAARAAGRGPAARGAGAPAVRLRAQRRTRPPAGRGPPAAAGRPAGHLGESRTSSSAGTSPGSAAAGSGWSATTGTSPPR
jgi:Mg-chelatase subunit ChlD